MPRSAPPDRVANVPSGPPSGAPDAPVRRRPGRPEAAPEARRSVTMGVRVSAAERARLEAKAAAVGVPVTAFLRLAADGVVPRAVPQVNRDQWAELAHLARTLGRLERALAGMRTPLMPGEVLAQLDAFRPAVSALAGDVHAVRNALLGRDPAGRVLRYADEPEGTPDAARPAEPEDADDVPDSRDYEGAHEGSAAAEIRPAPALTGGELRNSAVPIGASECATAGAAAVPSDYMAPSPSAPAPSHVGAGR